jgi:hypothetical protein
MINLDFLYNKKNLVYLATLAVLIIIYLYLTLIPHFDENGTYKVFYSKYYSKAEAILTENYNKIEIRHKELEELYTHATHANKTLQHTNKKLSKDKDKLNSQNNMMNSKLHQQEQFLQEQAQEVNQKKQQADIEKKTSFSNVSMNTITNDRPKLGNMISKNIKQFDSN